jgi:glycosyltransferase involved in cell wall biosynthesis
MKLLFLINGSEKSAAGGRAQAFASRLPADWTIQLAYRPARKWKGILPFVRQAGRLRPDVIYVMDTAYTGVLAGCLARRLYGCRLVTDTGDAAYELAQSAGTYTARQLALIRAVENLAMRHSDRIVVRGSYHQELLEESGLDKVTFIPDGVDLNATQPTDAVPLRSELGWEDGLILGLVGTMLWSERHQMCYGWDIVEALGLLRDVPVRALLVGDGDGRARLEQRARELGVSDRVVITGLVPYDQLPRYLSAMDICVSTQSNDVVGMVRTTGKLPLYLACGRYVAATDVGEARKVLPGVGSLLPYQGVRDDSHPARLADLCRRLLAQPDLRPESDCVRQVAAKHFEYGMLTARVAQLCRELSGKRD